MNKKIIVCLFIFVFLFSNQTVAQAFLIDNGFQLLQDLIPVESKKEFSSVFKALSEKERLKAFIALGFLAGVATTHKNFILENCGIKFACLPPDIIIGQIALIVSKYLKTHPELLHETAFILIFRALDESFPCKK